MTAKIALAFAAATLAFAAGAQTAPSAPVASASPPAPAAKAPKGYYYWLHPKLGMVKVDRATNAMVKGTRS